jgi:hypothetical protein
MDKKIRTLSEEFHSLSPKSQSMVKFHTTHSPTSKYKKEYTSMDKYNESNPTERAMMEQYGLVVIPFRNRIFDANKTNVKSNLTKKLETK